mgnify:CR=1 FL=1
MTCPAGSNSSWRLHALWLQAGRNRSWRHRLKAHIKDIGRAIRKLADEGLNGQKMAVVLVEQFYDFAAELADQYLVMERGEIIKRGRGPDMEADGVRQLMSI